MHMQPLQGTLRTIPEADRFMGWRVPLGTRTAHAPCRPEAHRWRPAQRQFDATGSNEVLYRQAMHSLQAAASSPTGGAPARVLLDGPSGSGKSVALAAQAARARAGGAVVLYVPSAFALIQDAFFSRCHRRQHRHTAC